MSAIIFPDSNNNESLKYCENYQNVTKRHSKLKLLEKMVPRDLVDVGCHNIQTFNILNSVSMKHNETAS